VDLSELLSDFIDEVLAAHNAYTLSEIRPLEHETDADAILRLRLRICDALIADGWAPNEEAASQLATDRRLLHERDDDWPPEQPPQQRVEPQESQRTHSPDAEQELAQMRRALDSRAIIEQAKGIAMGRYGLTAERAWAWLVRESQSRNIKLRVIAEQLVEEAAQGSHMPAFPATAEESPEPTT
jgi:hypothetical protein